MLGKMDIDDFLTVVPTIICKNVLLVYSDELICQTRPDPRLPIIKCLHTITYPAISWCVKNQPDGWSSMGDAQAELNAACRRAGLGSWEGAWAGQQVSVAYQSAGGVMGRWGGGTNLVFFLSILGFVLLLTLSWCDSTGYWDPRELYAEALN